MIQFTKAAVYIPDPVRSKPPITDKDKALAAEEPPWAVRLFCKPWMDTQSVGWTIFYGYLTSITIVGLGNGQYRIENLEQLQAESKVDNIFMPLAGVDLVGIPATGYTFLTQPGYISMILPPNNPPPGWVVEPGVIETDWYPMEMAVVFRVPPEGESITLDYKMEIARIVPIPRLERMKMTPMTEENLAELMERRERYIEERDKFHGKPARADHGPVVLKQSYNKWSLDFRRNLSAHDDES